MAEAMTPRRSANDRQSQAQVNPWLVLAVIGMGVFILLVDTTIVNVAQVAIREGLKTDLSAIQWVLDAYLLAFAVLLLTFGRLGDVFGRKRLFIIGLALFGISSALCGFSGWIGDQIGVSGASMLITFRALQGIAGAVMMPQTLSLLMSVFPAERRGAAMGIWGAITALGAVLGPIIGGYLVTNYDWEWIFFINVPIAALTIFLGLSIIPESSDPDASRSPDWLGILFSGVGILTIVYALIEANSRGWTSVETLGLIGVGIVMMAAFVWWELRAPDPMMKMELFKIRNFWVGNIITALSAFGLFGLFFPMTIFLQSILGYSAIKAGLTTAPVAITIMLVAPLSGRLSDYIGSRWLLLGGLTIASIGLLTIVRLTNLDSTPYSLMPGFIVMGLGMGMTFPAMTNAVMLEVPPRIAGSASGVLNTVRNIGQVIGIAVLGTVLQSWAGSQTSTHLQGVGLPQDAHDQIVAAAGEGRLQVIPGIVQSAAPDSMQAVLRALDLGFLDSMHYTLYLSTAVMVAGIGMGFLVRTVVAGRETEQAAAPSTSPEARPAYTGGDN